MKYCVQVVSLLFFLCSAHGYKPVIMMHGIDDSGEEFMAAQREIKKQHPGTVTEVLQKFDDEPGSWAPMWDQVECISKKIRALIAKNPVAYKDGFHLLCHSQGGLICRGIVQNMDDHNIDTLVSLAGVQFGEYGPYGFLQKIEWVLPTIWLLLYNPIAQRLLSVANFWHDPHHPLSYRRHVRFLPEINNEVITKDSPRYKANFLALNKAVFFASNGDECIIPWQSSHFGFYDKDMNVVTMKSQPIYKDDTFGLRTMDEQGKLVLTMVPNLSHGTWVEDMNIFRTYVLPHLV